MENEFEKQASGVEGAPEQQTESKSKELNAENFKQNSFIKVPNVGDTLELEVQKVLDNPEIKGKNSETGKAFSIGLKDKNEKVRRYDIITEMGIFTINSWQIYFNLLGSGSTNEGLLLKYAKKHDGSFRGAKISIKRLFNGTHASREVSELALLRKCTEEEAKVYKEEVKLAMKEKRLYEVKLLN